MGIIFDDWFPPTLAALTRLNPVPLEPFYYGLDLAGVEDVTDDWALVDPASNQAIGEALLRRLLTPRGGLISDPEYGVGIPQMLSRGMTTTEIQGIKRLCTTECLKDDRVSAVDVRVTYDGTTEEMRIDVTVTPQDSNRTFALILALTGDGVARAEIVGVAA